MYILTLVTTLLMLLAIVGATRFDLFLSAMGISTAYETYMQDDERSYLNAKEKAKYDAPTKQASGSEGGAKRETKAPVSATAKLNIGPLILEKAGGSPEYRESVKRTLIRLIEVLYGHQKFFEAVNIPEFVDVLIDEAQEGVCGGKIKQVSDLAGVKFANPAMRRIFYLMIRQVGRGQGRNTVPSLLDFLTLRAQEAPIRIFLAKRPLLLALYQNAAAVDQLMEYRQHPFNVYVPSQEALSETVDADEADSVPKLGADDRATLQQASEQFKIQSFNSQRYPDIPETFLDFTVSGTTPPK